MARAIKTTRKVCTCCGKEKPPTTGFYLSHSVLYKHNDGRMSVCKDCLFERYQMFKSFYNDEVKALYHLCMGLDIYFSVDLVDKSYLQSNVANDEYSLLRNYIKNVNSLHQYKGKTSLDSDHLIMNEKAIKEIEDKYKVEKEQILENTKLNEDIAKNKDILERWGLGRPVEEYVFLENIYKEFTDVYESRTPAQKLIFKNIAKSTLEGDKALRSNNPNVFEKMNNVVSKLMTDGNIKPIQEASVAEDDTATWGKWINLIEQERPIGEASEQFKDVDKISSYITQWFTKQMQRVFDLSTGDNDDNQN